MVIKDLLFEELKAYLVAHQLPGYRANQIFDWVYQKKAYHWEQMTNLPHDMRQKLSTEGVRLGCLLPLTTLEASDGTIKYLFELLDQENIESVFLPETERNTVCFSTQVGCKMGCAFCATGKNGLIRNLTTAEIVDQIIKIEALTGSKVTNLVAMGQGEPLANYDALLKAIAIMHDPKGLGLGARRITVSTCGMVPGILKLADEPYQVNLAISLHAAEDQLRDTIMPINKIYPLQTLMEACKVYLAKTGRRITYEYTLIDGVNDRAADVENLIWLLGKTLCHVNLIPYNPIKEAKFQRSRLCRIKAFADELNRVGIEATIRKERGASLAAACGQLQSRRLEEE